MKQNRYNATTFYEYVDKTINKQENWISFIKALGNLELIATNDMLKLSSNKETNNVVNDLFEALENHIYHLITDRDFTLLGNIVGLLEMAGVKTVSENILNSIEINPMPRFSYFVGKFLPEKIFFNYKGSVYQLNWNMYLEESQESIEYAVWFANNILKFLESDKRIYFFYDVADELRFITALNEKLYVELSEELELPFYKNDCAFDMNDYKPIDLSKEIEKVTPVYQELVTHSTHHINLDNSVMLVVPESQSMSSIQAQQWFEEQKDVIEYLYKVKVLPSPFDKLSYNNQVNKLGKIFNIFIAITRQLIADPRVIDSLYKRYPLLTVEQYEKIVELLKSNKPNVKNNADILKEFVFLKNTAKDLIGHIYNNERKNNILNQALFST